jgi:hypothetical protein
MNFSIKMPYAFASRPLKEAFTSSKMAKFKKICFTNAPGI